MQPTNRPRSVDGFRTVPSRQSVAVPPRSVTPPAQVAPIRPPQLSGPQPTPQVPPAAPHPQPAAATPPHKRWVSLLQLAVVIAVGVAAGLVLQIVPLAYVGVVVYGLVALVKRIPSRLTFLLALGALLCAPAGIAIGSGAAANGFAMLGFLLLSVGVITLGFELKQQKGGSESKKQEAPTR